SEHERERGPGPQRDEELRAAEDPGAAVPFGPRRETRWVRARARLGQRVAAEPFARAERRQPVAALLLGAPLDDRLPYEPDVHRDDPADGRVAAAELLAQHAVRDRVEAQAAVGLGQGGAEEARCRELRDDAAIHALRPVPVARVRRHLARDD